MVCLCFYKKKSDQFPTYYFACSHKARYNKPIRILKLWKTSNHQSSQSETVRAIDSFFYTISFDMTDLDKTKPIWLCDREKIVAILFLAGFLVAAKLCCKGDDRTELKISRDMFDLFISVFLCYKSNFRQKNSIRFWWDVWNDTSWKVGDRWNNILQSYQQFPNERLKEMSRIRSSSARISVNPHRSALSAGCLFAWFEGPPLAFSYKGSLVHDKFSAKKLYSILFLSGEMSKRRLVGGNNWWNTPGCYCFEWNWKFSFK